MHALDDQIKSRLRLGHALSEIIDVTVDAADSSNLLNNDPASAKPNPMMAKTERSGQVCCALQGSLLCLSLN